MWKSILKGSQNLSLHIVAITVVHCLALAKVLEQTVPTHSVILLGLAVWVIYSTDHLLDSFKLISVPKAGRHYFHYRNSTLMIFTILLVCFLAFYLTIFIPAVTRWIGLGLTVFSVLYFTLIHKYNARFKEFFAAFVFSLGSITPLIQDWDFILDPRIVISFILLFFLVIMNLLVFSIFDLRYDRINGFDSLLQHIGLRKMNNILTVIKILTLIIFAEGFSVSQSENFSLFLLAYLAIYIFLSILHLFPARFSKGNLHQLVGDGIFLAPVIILIV
jgi:4-hydroxybenzoate polyprenyltransferase